MNGSIREIKRKARVKAKEATRSDGCKRMKEEMGSKYLQKKTTGQRDIATEERTKFCYFAVLYRCKELATQLISHHASIFLGVILLGMNKSRSWKCPWTTSKKRKKRTKNENTAMNEQAKATAIIRCALLQHIS